MPHLIDHAIAKVRQLPESDQEALASIILREIDSEARWEELLSRPESVDLLSRMTDQALAEAKEGRSKRLNLNDL